MNEQTELSFHNTTNLKDEELKEAEIKCSKQEREILEYYNGFNAYDWSELGVPPSMVWRNVFGGKEGKTLLTSVRRAITNLTKKGYLRKTDIKVKGPYGAKEHCWELI